MVELTVYTFSASSSCEINAKPLCPLLLELVSFGIACIELRVTLVEGRSFFDLLVTICKELVIPNIVVVVAFNVSCLLF